MTYKGYSARIDVTTQRPRPDRGIAMGSAFTADTGTPFGKPFMVRGRLPSKPGRIGIVQAWPYSPDRRPEVHRRPRSRRNCKSPSGPKKYSLADSRVRTARTRLAFTPGSAPRLVRRGGAAGVVELGPPLCVAGGYTENR